VTDPRFFRQYLDILDEQSLPAGVNQPATVNVGNNTTVTADPNAKTVAAKSQIGDLNLQATTDVAKGATSVVADYKVAPGSSVGVTQTQTGYKGQIAPSSQLRASQTDTTGQTHNVRIDKGVGFGGAGKNVQPGQNIQTTYTKT
jgi:hypothetical protein